MLYIIKYVTEFSEPVMANLSAKVSLGPRGQRSRTRSELAVVRGKKNKAGYEVESFACDWAGEVNQ